MAIRSLVWVSRETLVSPGAIGGRVEHAERVQAVDRPYKWGVDAVSEHPPDVG
jgi:hypothetical protein